VEWKHQRHDPATEVGERVAVATPPLNPSDSNRCLKKRSRCAERSAMMENRYDEKGKPYLEAPRPLIDHDAHALSRIATDTIHPRSKSSTMYVLLTIMGSSYDWASLSHLLTIQLLVLSTYARKCEVITPTPPSEVLCRTAPSRYRDTAHAY
jgi:hypothetical protein